MTIENCTPDDLNEISNLYIAARALQTERKMVVWPPFSDEFLLKEIKENRQWKLTENYQILCNWAITFSDREIWEARDQNDAIYIHRICNHPKHRGNRYIDQIVAWAKIYALQLNKKFIRLDTLGNNTKLIHHYTSAGFTFLGMFKLTQLETLPAHYQNEPNCCLFEIKI